MTCKCENPTVIKLRQGDDSDFNNNHIIFHIVTKQDLTGWKAVFQLQHATWTFNEINNNQIDLVISQQQTNSFETGTCYGWLKLIDSRGKQGTIYSQKFQIMRREVF